MNLTLHRIYLDHGTLGILEAAGHRWWTLEPPVGGGSVPEGSYALEPHSGAKWKDTWALVGNGVVHWPSADPRDRETVLVHVGNTLAETAGCILIGTGALLTGPRVLGSRQAYEEWRALMRDHASEANTLRITRG